MSNVEKLFQCRQCGFCCHGESTVSLNETDQKNMIAALNLARAQVAERYWRVNGTRVQMKTIEGRCIFYREGCTVYPGRPWRCAQWPLVPAILHDENNFITIRESCPGISRELSYEEFKKILARLLDSDPAAEE